MHTQVLGLNSELKAALAGVIANIILGASSLYWKALGDISPQTLLCYRILISLLTIAAILAINHDLRSIINRISLRLLIVHTLAAVFVVINWGTFIWVSINGHVLESGLGYLLAPFVAITVGAFALGEKLSLTRLLALMIIAIAVSYLFTNSSDLSHWVYITIGITWGGYACLKKLTTLDSFSGLLVETSVLTVFIPLMVLILPITLSLPNTISFSKIMLLGLCGLVSVIPLALFAFAASRLALSIMGFFQFVLPLTQLFVALAIYRQPVSHNTLLCFSIIAIGLVLIVAEQFIQARKLVVNKI
jgi:chloramphenicol-sensitive protein RarD